MRTLAATVDRWWTEIAAFISTGHSNAKSEGINRVVKLDACNAFGFGIVGRGDPDGAPGLTVLDLAPATRAASSTLGARTGHRLSEGVAIAMEPFR